MSDSGRCYGLQCLVGWWWCLLLRRRLSTCGRRSGRLSCWSCRSCGLAKYFVVGCFLCKLSSTQLIVLGFNDTSTLVGHFVSYPREREKRDRRGSR